MKSSQASYKKHRKLGRELKTVSWGTPRENLRSMKLTEYEDLHQKGFHLVIIDGIIHDITDFVSAHPGARSDYYQVLGKMPQIFSTEWFITIQTLLATYCQACVLLLYPHNDGPSGYRRSSICSVLWTYRYEVTMYSQFSLDIFSN